MAGVHPLAEKDPKAPTIIANGVSVPIASLDLDTLEELCNMERTLLNTSLPTKHFEDDIVENEVKQASSSKFAAFRRDARDAKNNGHGSNGTNSNKPETNSPVRAPAKRKQSMGTALVALDKHQHVEGSTVMGDPSLSGILGGSSPMLMTASQKRAHRKKLSKQLSNSTHVSVQSFDFESEESNKALITALLEMAHDEGQLEHALSLKQGLETHILGLASVLTKSYDYLNSKYPEYKREYYQKQVERYEQQKSGRYSSGASTVFMKNIHQNNGEGKVGAATGAYERVRKIAFHNQKLTKEILANNRKNSTVGCFGSVPESVNRSNNSSTSGTTTTTNTTNPSSNQDAMSLQRHTWKYAQRLFDESIVLETDIRQLQFLTKYNLNLKHPTFTSHAHGHRLDSHGVSSSDSSSSISSGHADDDDLIQQLQLAALRDQGQQKYSEQQHTTGDSSSAHRPSRYHGHEHGNGHGSAPDVIKTIESIDTDAFADSFVYPTGASASASASMGARVMVMGRNNRQSESGEAAGMGVKPAPMTRARSSTVGDNDMLDPSGQAWQTPPVAHSATGKVSGYSHLVTKDAAGDSKGATDHSLKGELSRFVCSLCAKCKCYIVFIFCLFLFLLFYVVLYLTSAQFHLFVRPN